MLLEGIRFNDTYQGSKTSRPFAAKYASRWNLLINSINFYTEIFAMNSALFVAAIKDFLRTEKSQKGHWTDILL